MKTQQVISVLARRIPTIAIALVAFVSVFAVLVGDVEERHIDTFAGTNIVGFGGDGGPATEAHLYGPRGLAVDGSGNLYVADDINRRIRRIDPGGVITTIAGTGEWGFGGDGGPATKAQFRGLQGLAVDGSGNLYVADASNQRIRRIDPDGVITTIAGTGERGFGGDGGPATEAQLYNPVGLAVDGSGNLYVADYFNQRIRRIDPDGVITTIAGTGERGFGGDDGPATEAQLNFPVGLAVDGSGNLYVADYLNQRIRRIDPDGVITTIAGTGEPGFGGDDGPATEAHLHSPVRLAVDGSGNLYVSDSLNQRIRRIDPDGVITTIAGTEDPGFGGDGGPAAEAHLNSPNGLAVDGSGNLYVADYNNHRVRVIRPPGERNPVTHEFPHFANGGSTVSDLVLVNVDTKTVIPVVRFYSSNGDPISADMVVDVTEDMDVAADGALSVTAGIAPLGERTISTHGRGDLRSGSVTVVTDGYVGGLLRFDSMAVGVAGVGAAQPVSDAIFPARRKEGGINTGAALRNLESEATTLTCHLMQGGEVLNTAMVELAGTGQQARFINELFADADTSDFAGSVRCTAPEGRKYTGVALEMDIGNRIFTTLPLVEVTTMFRGDVEEPYIYTFAGTGILGFGGDGGPATEAHLLHPVGLAVDGSGNLYVADSSNQRIRRIDPEGVIATIAGRGEWGHGGELGDGGPATEAYLNPIALAVDGSGNLYVAERSNHRIRWIDPEGVITTIAGTGKRGFGGDGGPATEAQLNFPTGLAVDGSGNLYVADQTNHRIRRIDPEGVITTFAGTGDRGFGGDGGPATEARFNLPYGLAVDGSGNLYVADRYNQRIRRIDPEGVITTIAGTGDWGFSGDGGPATDAQLSYPTELAVDGSGYLYVVDNSNHRVRRIDPEGIITTIAGGDPGFGGDGGPATDAHLNNPYGLAVDGSGNLYVADHNNQRVRVIRPPGERNPVTHEFPHFANGGSTVSDLVLVNVDTKTVTPVVRFYGSNGDPISADAVVEVTEDMEVAADGALSVTAGIAPLGERTISTHGRGDLTSGSVTAVTDGYVGGLLRFDSMAVGVAGVGAAQPVNDAIFPARRKAGGINTGAALRNLESEATTLTCHLMQGGEVLNTAMVELAWDRTTGAVHQRAVCGRRHLRLFRFGALHRARGQEVHRNRPGVGHGKPHLHDVAAGAGAVMMEEIASDRLPRAATPAESRG